MRIFVTGAPGFIGSALVPELIQAGHQVLGLTRSEAGAESCERRGAEVLHGNIEDLDSLREGAAKSDGVIHLAFNHDFSQFQKNCEDDRKAIEAIGEVLLGSNRPFVSPRARRLRPMWMASHRRKTARPLRGTRARLRKRR
jgi:nucleoside-diphosphate-sugar epimerase